MLLSCAAMKVGSKQCSPITKGVIFISECIRVQLV